MPALIEQERTNILNLTPLDTALKRLERRRHDRRIMNISDPGLLNLGYRPATESEGSGFFIEANPSGMSGALADWFRTNKRMDLSENAVKSILMHGGIAMPDKMLPKRLPLMATEALRIKMESMRGLNLISRSSKNGIGERVVEAFVPGKINTLPDHQLMTEILERLKAKYGDRIMGLRNVAESDDAVQRYWVIFGKPVTDEKPGNPQLKTYPMLDVNTSDIGMGSVEVSLGLMRIICVNGAIRTDWKAGNARWNRIGEPNSFFEQLKGVIDVAGNFASNMSDRLMSASKSALGAHPIELVDALGDKGIFNKRQREVADMIVRRDDPQNEYEFFQAATESAQVLKGSARRRAESLALRIVSHDGGFTKVAQNGVDAKAMRNDLAGLA